MTHVLIEMENYTLEFAQSNNPNLTWWLQNKDGQGMCIGEAEFEKIFDNYFKENF